MAASFGARTTVKKTVATSSSSRKRGTTQALGAIVATWLQSFLSLRKLYVVLLFFLASFLRLGRTVPPMDVSNFQNDLVCSEALRIVRPRTVQDVQDAVVLHHHVMPMGAGHSWNKPFLCASLPDTDEDSDLAQNGRTSANIVLTTIRPLSITVDEDEETSWIDAGIKIEDVLYYLGNYVTKNAPRGWTIGAAPNFHGQSIGGAVATGTHGGSLTHGSLSKQVAGFRVVFANGTVGEVTPDSHPFLMKAFRVSLGKLGIITSVKLKIVREEPVMRKVTRGLRPSGFLDMLRDAQEMFNRMGEMPPWTNESIFNWFVQDHEFVVFSFLRGDNPDPTVRNEVLSRVIPEESTISNDEIEMGGEQDGVNAEARKILDSINKTRINVPLAGKAAIRSNYPDDPLGVAKGVTWEPPEKVKANGLLEALPIDAWAFLIPNATLEAHQAYIEFPNEIPAGRALLVGNFEPAIPVTTMADCFEGVMKLIYDGDLDGIDGDQKAMDKGFRLPPIIRFVGKEDGLLSPVNDYARIYFSLADDLPLNTGMQDEQLFKLMRFLMGSPLCSSRLHWGKGGWPDEGCWNGGDYYPDTWCDFGCAVRALDPEGKFTDSAADRWNWEGVDLDRCCTENGYDRSWEGCTCSVIPSKSVEDCPPPPFYTKS